MQHRYLKTILAELRTELENLYGKRLARVMLFGSQARHDAREHSNIDVLVVLKGQVYAGAEIEYTGGLVSELSLRYDTVILLVFVSEERYECNHSGLLFNVRQEGILIS